MRFSLKLSHPGQGFLAFLSVHPTITFGLIHRFQVCFSVTRQFSAGIVILSEDLRYAQIIRERPGLWWNIAALPRFST